MINMRSILTYSLAILGIICFLSVFFESNNPQIIFSAILIGMMGSKAAQQRVLRFAKGGIWDVQG